MIGATFDFRYELKRYYNPDGRFGKVYRWAALIRDTQSFGLQARSPNFRFKWQARRWAKDYIRSLSETQTLSH